MLLITQKLQSRRSRHDRLTQNPSLKSRSEIDAIRQRRSEPPRHFATARPSGNPTEIVDGRHIGRGARCHVVNTMTTKKSKP